MKKTTLLGIALAISALFSVKAQTDYTEVVINPSFETFTIATDYTGWTWTGRTGGWLDVNTDGDATKNGTYIAGYWNNFIEDVECSQTLTGLPPGYYKVTALATVSTNRTTTQRLFANSKSILYGAASNPAYSEANLAILGATETYSFGGYAESTAETGPFKKLSVITQVLDGNLTFGFRLNGKGTALGYDFSYSPKDDAGFFKFDGFTLTEVSTVATLDKITLSAGALDSVFKSDIITYTATLPVGTTTVTPTAVVSVEGEIVSGAGAVDVSSGTGSSTILVTALDGETTNTYTINYTVLSLSNDATLSALTTSTGTLTPAFDPAVTAYKVLLPIGTTTVTPTATKNDTKSSVSGATEVTLVNEKGTSTIVVTAENGTTKTYTLNYEIEYIVNPSFETGDLTGWTWTGADGYGWLGPNTDGDATKDGSFTCGIWNASIGDAECSQTITGVPSGYYKITALATVSTNRLTTQRLFANTKSILYGAASNPAYSEANLAILGATETYSFGGYAESTAENGSFKKLSVVTQVLDGNLTIGFRVNGKGTALGYDFSYSPKDDAGFFKFDNFTIAEVSKVATLDSITLSVGVVDSVFKSDIITYTATLPLGTTTVTPTVFVSAEGEIVSGAGAVDVSSGTGSSSILVTALDGTTTKTYTINYNVGSSAGVKSESENKVSYSVIGKKLMVKGAESFVVYNLQGIKIADVRENTSNTTVSLNTGIYLVKTNARTFKVLVK